jgi:hypothetical protein
MLKLVLPLGSPARMTCGDRAAEVSYRRIDKFPYLLVRDAETGLAVYQPISRGLTTALIVGGESVLITAGAIKPGSASVEIDAPLAVLIVRDKALRPTA